MSDWTKEPWHVGPHYKSDVESPSGHICECGITRGVDAEKKAAHIVACHNACLSMADHEADVQALVEALEKIKNITDGHPINGDRRDRIHSLAKMALGKLRREP